MCALRGRYWPFLFTSPDTFHASPTSVSRCKTLQMSFQRISKAGDDCTACIFIVSLKLNVPSLPSTWMPEKSQASLGEKSLLYRNCIFGLCRIDLSYIQIQIHFTNTFANTLKNTPQQPFWILLYFAELTCPYPNTNTIYKYISKYA